jgi:REP element-mobilizing transposase RayT
MPRFRTSSHGFRESKDGHHRFEHWYRDNTVYFITARCRDRFHAFRSEEAKSVFWDRFDHYTAQYGFVPWVTTLLDNHYHTIGYLKIGTNLGPMMQRIHGSVAKLVNDLLPERRVPFWREGMRNDYFDGCIRNEKQSRRAYRYTQKQSVRHGLAHDWRKYPHTRIRVELDRGVARSVELNAFLDVVPYPRYGEQTCRTNKT